MRFRLDKILDKDKARRVYDKISSCVENRFENAEEYLDFLDEIGLSQELQTDGLYNYQLPVNHKYDEECLAFWETIWPCFCNALNKEVQTYRLDFR